MGYKNILTVYRIDGKYDLAIGFLVKDLRTYQTAFENILQQYRHYIADKHFSVFIEYLRFHRNYLIEKKRWDYSAISTGSGKLFAYDQQDLTLLQEISENARITLLELAQKLKMTAAGVKYKLKNLEKLGVIVGYTIIFDFHALGYEYYKVDLEVEDLKILSGLHEFAKRHPHIIYRDITVGGSDFEFDCELQSQNDFYTLMDEIKALFPQKIRHYFYYKALKIYKYAYFPEDLLYISD